jgi:tetratricopeptide (TPR) repeat protein
VFEDDAGKPLAKIIDFAYSSLTKDKDGIVYPPRTSPWVMDPEWHHRGFRLEAAKKLDAYSVGIVSAWTLFYTEIKDKFTTSDPTSVEQMLQKWKTQTQLVTVIVDLVENSGLDRWLRQGLVNFFTATLTDVVGNRQANLESQLHSLGSELLHQTSLSREVTLSSHIHISFHVMEYMLQILWTDHRLRSQIRAILEKRSQTKCPDCKETVAFQLAICYLAGFGTRRDTEKGFLWLATSGKTLEDVSLALKQVEERPVFQNGQFLELWIAGSITPFKLTTASLGHQILARAEQQFRGEVADFELFAGREHFWTTAIKILLADVLQAEDKLVEAAELYQQVMITKQPNSAGQNLGLETVMLDLASVLEEQGRWKESEAVLREFYQNIEATIGLEHPTSIMCHTMLSSVIAKQGRLEEAEHLDRDTLDRCLRHFGQTHSNSIKAMGNLAVTLEMRGCIEEAFSLERGAVEASSRLLGRDHPDTLTSRSNLAKTYGKFGQWEEAETELTKVLERRIQILGNVHRDTLATRAELASVFFHQGRFDEAVDVLSELQHQSEDVFGQDHPNHFTIQINLIEAYRKQGQAQEAYDLCEKTLTRAVQVLGEKDPKTMSLGTSQGTLYFEAGYIDYATTVFTDLVDCNIDVYGPKNAVTLSNTHSLAVCLNAQGDHDSARIVMEEVVRLRSDLLGQHHKDTQNSNRVLEAWIQRNEPKALCPDRGISPLPEFHSI